MSAPFRYRNELDGGMRADDEGKWVRHDDYTALLADRNRLAARVERLTAALTPFAEFARASGFDLVPDEMPMTQGSRMARRQVTAGDLRHARAALQED